MLDHMLHMVREIKAAQTAHLGGSEDMLISSAVDFLATQECPASLTKESRTTEAESFSPQLGMFSSLSGRQLWVKFRVRWTWLGRKKPAMLVTSAIIRIH